MKTTKRKKLTNKEILDKAQSVESREEFQTKAQAHYLESKTRGLIGVACRHMGFGYISKATSDLD